MNKTNLSVNLNKVALLRNARGSDYPSLVNFAKSCMEHDICGLTLHPRSDERHALSSDVIDLATLCKENNLELRAGINMGDVIIEGDNLFGDGVNVAARLEAIAPPGRICISGSVHSLVSNNVKEKIYSKGSQKLKNINKLRYVEHKNSKLEIVKIDELYKIKENELLEV